MDKEYFRQIGREVGRQIVDAIKSPPEGHPFYGNQWLNFGGGASGGNAPRTVAEGKVNPEKNSNGDYTGEKISSGTIFGRSNSRVGLNGGEHSGRIIKVDHMIRRNLSSREQTIYKARIEGISSGAGHITITQSSLERYGRIMKDQEPKGDLAKIHPNVDHIRYD